LASVRPDDLLATVVRALVARNPFPGEAYEDLIAGCASQAGEDGRNLARHAALLSGLPLAVGGLTVNRLCGSGLAAVLDAARALRCGEGELFVAGGAESMSRAPFVVAKAESAYSRDFRVFDSSIGARFPNPRVEAEFGADSMPETADNVARELGISREQADTYAAAATAPSALRQNTMFRLQTVRASGLRRPTSWLQAATYQALRGKVGVSVMACPFDRDWPDRFARLHPATAGNRHGSG
jgi:acetyl-CoA C-acetyltransferase